MRSRAVAADRGDAALPGDIQVDVVVVAAGGSRRMGGVDKLGAQVSGRPLLAWTLDALAAAPSVRRIALVTAPERLPGLAAAPWLPPAVCAVVAGGARRQDSVAAGVRALGDGPPSGAILVHDGARPLVTVELVERVARATVEHGAAIPVLPVAETLKRVVDGRVAGTIDRDGLGAAQTPQGVRRDVLARAYAAFPPEGPASFTDEAALLEACKIAVHALPGESTNLKVTLPDDLPRAEALLALTGRAGAASASSARSTVAGAAPGASTRALAAPRVGFGDDSHPFGPGGTLFLGGLRLDGAPRLHGHSDGDVVLHAVCDALLGGAALGDLGRVFPAGPTTPAGIASADLVAEVLRRVRAAGLRPASVDVTVVAARPRLAASLPAMAAAIAVLLGLPTGAVNVKASTGNLAGPEGAGRGVAARAVAVLDSGGRGVTIRLHDTLTGALRDLEPIEAGRVRVYSCGPTVYGPAHVGNFRSFLFADLLVRFLRWRGLAVTWVMNLTDVDDKIIRGANAEGVGIDALADRYIARFLEDAATLRMTVPDELPRATAHIPEMVALVERLLASGNAYGTEDGSIFFRIASWPAYGRLARLDPDNLRVGERVAADEYSKDDVRDFVLWKGAKPGEPRWETAIGPGRPGWHLECSAMSMRYLGPTFDIHTGGVDLIFPHHEDEIAQSEAATGQPFVRTWVHCAHLQMGGRKMAKSEGNIARVSELLATGVDARALRFALLAAHYRTGLNFSDESLGAATAAVERLDALVAALAGYAEERPDDPDLPAALAAAREAFGAALGDDLGISAALGAVFDLVRDLNRRVAARSLSSDDAGRALDALRDLDRVLGVLTEAGEAALEPDVRAMLDARATARAARDWAASDRLRDELAARGIAVEDTRDGQRWRRVGSLAGA